MATTDAQALPKKNTALRITFPIFDADGDLVTGATSPDSEVSKDAGTFADCTNEATEIATSSGMYYLELTATEMNADTVAIIVKSGSGKTTPIVLYPVDTDYEDIPTAVENGAAVWNAVASSHVTAGSFGQLNQLIDVGTATAGSTTSITLAADAPSVSLVGRVLVSTGGAGPDQKTEITDYNTGTKVATVTAVDVAFASGTKYVVV